MMNCLFIQYSTDLMGKMSHISLMYYEILYVYVISKIFIIKCIDTDISYV